MKDFHVLFPFVDRYAERICRVRLRRNLFQAGRGGILALDWSRQDVREEFGVERWCRTWFGGNLKPQAVGSSIGGHV